MRARTAARRFIHDKIARARVERHSKRLPPAPAASHIINDSLRCRWHATHMTVPDQTHVRLTVGLPSSTSRSSTCSCRLSRSQSTYATSHWHGYPLAAKPEMGITRPRVSEECEKLRAYRCATGLTDAARRVLSATVSAVCPRLAGTTRLEVAAARVALGTKRKAARLVRLSTIAARWIARDWVNGSKIFRSHLVCRRCSMCREGGEQKEEEDAAHCASRADRAGVVRLAARWAGRRFSKFSNGLQ